MKRSSKNKKLTAAQSEQILQVLQDRFEKNHRRHDGIKWAAVLAKLEANPDKLWSLLEMEKTGGEPDVTAFDKKLDEYTFVDCSPETPKGRISLCYDRQAWEERKENRPKGNCLDLAEAMGIVILTETEYRELQKLGEFDTKTSSWVDTPQDIRDLGGAIFCDRRYGHVFTYHNGAQSYYAARAFRGSLKV